MQRAHRRSRVIDQIVHERDRPSHRREDLESQPRPLQPGDQLPQVDAAHQLMNAGQPAISNVHPQEPNPIWVPCRERHLIEVGLEELLVFGRQGMFLTVVRNH